MLNPDMYTGLIPLFVIIILLGSALYFIKKSSFKFGRKNAPAIEIKTIASQMVAPKKYVSVIQVQNELLLIGISDNSVTLLKELDPLEMEVKQRRPVNENSIVVPERKTRTAAAPVSSNGADNNDFAAILKKNLGIK